MSNDTNSSFWQYITGTEAYKKFEQDIAVIVQPSKMDEEYSPYNTSNS